MKDTNRPRRSRHIQAAPSGPEAKQIGSRVTRGALAAVSAVALGLMSMGYFAIGNLSEDLAQANNLNLGQQADGATDILLVGVDSRSDAQGNPLSQKEIDMLRAGEENVANTDTIILIRVPNDGSSATAVSLPRDTYVKTPDHGNMKLNGVYGTAKYEKSEELEAEGTDDQSTIDKESTEAGRQALIKTVADLTGITVDHYAEVGLLGFVLLTDAVGGVDVCLNEPVDEPLSGARFPAGYQTLNGPDALSFVRQRHELPRGDLDRITRQQAYMASLANHILSSKTLTDPGAIGRLNSAVQRSVVLDDGWDVMGMASQMQNLAGGNVSFQTIPVTSIDGIGDHGESVVTVDSKQVHEFFDELLGDKDEDRDGEASESSEKPKDPPADFTAGDHTVSVFNAGEIEGLAARVSEIVAEAGFRTGEVGNYAETGVSESQVNALDPQDPAAQALAEKLGGLPVVEDSTLAPGELSVTLAGTYDGPGATEEVVGTPGETDAGEDVTKPIDAGSNAPMCVN